MEEGLKKRLIGAAVLASLAVIFVPMLFEEPPSRPPPLPPLPSRPPVNDFASEMLREEVPAVTPLAPPSPGEYRKDVSVASSAAPVTPAPVTKPRTGLTAWVVQVGSFSSQENAAKLVAKLREAKLPTPDPDPVDLRGKRYYRVRVGPVVERSEADGMLDRVSAIAGTRARVQQYP
jgi:DedD protein